MWRAAGYLYFIITSLTRQRPSWQGMHSKLILSRSSANGGLCLQYVTCQHHWPGASCNIFHRHMPLLGCAQQFALGMAEREQQATDLYRYMAFTCTNARPASRVGVAT